MRLGDLSVGDKFRFEDTRCICGREHDDPKSYTYPAFVVMRFTDDEVIYRPMFVTSMDVELGLKQKSIMGCRAGYDIGVVKIQEPS